MAYGRPGGLGAIDERARIAAIHREGLGDATSIIATGISVVSKLFPNKDDKNVRMPANRQAYDMAVQGDAGALAYLRARSGRFGVIAVPSIGLPGTPGAIGGWATQAAKDDAWNKFQQASVMAAGSAAQGGVPGSAVVPGGELQQPLATPGVQQASMFGGGAILPLVLAGALAYAITSKPKGRRRR